MAKVAPMFARQAAEKDRLHPHQHTAQGYNNEEAMARVQARVLTRNCSMFWLATFVSALMAYAITSIRYDLGLSPAGDATVFRWLSMHDNGRTGVHTHAPSALVEMRAPAKAGAHLRLSRTAADAEPPGADESSFQIDWGSYYGASYLRAASFRGDADGGVRLSSGRVLSGAISSRMSIFEINPDVRGDVELATGGGDVGVGRRPNGYKLHVSGAAGVDGDLVVGKSASVGGSMRVGYNLTNLGGNPGEIRYTGSDFEGFVKDRGWRTLTDTFRAPSEVGVAFAVPYFVSAKTQAAAEGLAWDNKNTRLLLQTQSSRSSTAAALVFSNDAAANLRNFSSLGAAYGSAGGRPTVEWAATTCKPAASNGSNICAEQLSTTVAVISAADGGSVDVSAIKSLASRLRIQSAAELRIGIGAASALTVLKGSVSVDGNSFSLRNGANASFISTSSASGNVAMDAAGAMTLQSAGSFSSAAAGGVSIASSGSSVKLSASSTTTLSSGGAYSNTAGGSMSMTSASSATLTAASSLLLKSPTATVHATSLRYKPHSGSGTLLGMSARGTSVLVDTVGFVMRQASKDKLTILSGTTTMNDNEVKLVSPRRTVIHSDHRSSGDRVSLDTESVTVKNSLANRSTVLQMVGPKAQFRMVSNDLSQTFHLQSTENTSSTWVSDRLRISASRSAGSGDVSLIPLSGTVNLEGSRLHCPLSNELAVSTSGCCGIRLEPANGVLTHTAKLLHSESPTFFTVSNAAGDIVVTPASGVLRVNGKIVTSTETISSGGANVTDIFGFKSSLLQGLAADGLSIQSKFKKITLNPADGTVVVSGEELRGESDSCGPGFTVSSKCNDLFLKPATLRTVNYGNLSLPSTSYSVDMNSKLLMHDLGLTLRTGETMTFDANVVSFLYMRTAMLTVSSSGNVLTVFGKALVKNTLNVEGRITGRGLTAGGSITSATSVTATGPVAVSGTTTSGTFVSGAARISSGQVQATIVVSTTVRDSGTSFKLTNGQLTAKQVVLDTKSSDGGALTIASSVNQSASTQLVKISGTAGQTALQVTTGRTVLDGNNRNGDALTVKSSIAQASGALVTVAGVAGQTALSVTGNIVLDGAITATSATTFQQGFTDGTATLSGSGALSGVTTLAMTGPLSGATAGTFSGNLQGGAIKDGTMTISSGAVSAVTTLAMTGALSGATTGTFSGAVTGGSLTDGTATLGNGALSAVTTLAMTGVLSGATAGTFSGNLQGGAIKDGTMTIASGALSAVTTIAMTGALTGSTALTASGAVTGGSLTDGTATLDNGALSAVTTLAMTGAISGTTTVTASGAVKGGSLTDGTATLDNGALASATTGTFSGLVTAGNVKAATFKDTNGVSVVGTQQAAVAAAATVAAVTTQSFSATPTQAEVTALQAELVKVRDSANDLKVQLNLALAALRAHGLIAA